MLMIANSVFLWLSVALLVIAAWRQAGRRLPLVLAGISAGLASILAFLIEPSEFALLQLTPLRMLILAMIFIVAWAVIDYSKQAIAEEQNAHRYWRWLYATLAAVVLVIISNHLLLLWGSWVVISLSLHRLLIFYPDRPRAKLAAHKKFIIARTAEFCLLTAFILLGSHFHSFYLSDILSAWNEHSILTIELEIAAVLIAITALLKCAQLPVHGWLIQVVEAPTPISALLHAGVVNLGGFILLITAPIVFAVPIAQWVVLVVAGITAVLSALIMITRVSIKVKLAWSTSAQMGMMLVEIALGLYELAIVHLLAHSIYKAYAFLSAGSAVNQTLQRRLAQAKNALWHDWLVSLIVSAGLVTLGAVAYALTAELIFSKPASSPLSVLLLFTAALTMLLAQRHSSEVNGNLWGYSTLALLLVLAYFGLKLAAAPFVPEVYPSAEAFLSMPDIWVSLLILALVVVSMLLHLFPERSISQKLSMILFAGLYLDEWSTRITLAIWPIHPRAKAGNENNAKEKFNARS